MSRRSFIMMLLVLVLGAATLVLPGPVLAQSPPPAASTAAPPAASPAATATEAAPPASATTPATAASTPTSTSTQSTQPPAASGSPAATSPAATATTPAAAPSAPAAQPEMNSPPAPKVAGPFNFLQGFVLFLYFLVCVGLILCVMFQTTKSEGLTGIIGGSTQSTLFRGKKSMEEQLNQWTSRLAWTFLISSLFIWLLLSRGA